MSQLSELLTKIEAAREASDVNLHNHDYRTRPGAELAKEVAKKELSGLINEYKDVVGKGVAKIFLSGATRENAKKFVELLKKEKLSVSFPDSLYTHIAETVYPKLSGGGLYSTPAFLQLCETCRNLGGHFVVFPTVPPKNTGVDTIVKNVGELTPIVKNAVRAAYRDVLARSYINEQVFKEALNTRYTGNLLCVVIANSLPDERNSLAEVLFPQGLVFNVDLENEEPSRSHALRLYRKISETQRIEAPTTTTGN
jgi:hypothetical protein